MPDLKDERIDILSRSVQQLRANVDAEKAARERAQQALREIEDELNGLMRYSADTCFELQRLRTIAAIARKGLGETP